MTPLPGKTHEPDPRRAQAEADLINALVAPKPLPARVAALSGSFMGSKVAGAFHPASWSEGQRILRGRITG